jgi:hypothetical protein
LRKFPKTFHPRSSAANERKKAQHVRASSSIQTVTVGTGFTPVQRFRGRGLGPGAITAGGDLHPALKMNDSVVILFLHKKKNQIEFAFALRSSVSRVPRPAARPENEADFIIHDLRQNASIILKRVRSRGIV